jgi:hypothetical protein
VSECLLDLVDQLACNLLPTLACVGQLDPATPVAAAQEIADVLRPKIVQLALIKGAGL